MNVQIPVTLYNNTLASSDFTLTLIYLTISIVAVHVHSHDCTLFLTGILPKLITIWSVGENNIQTSLSYQKQFSPLFFSEQSPITTTGQSVPKLRHEEKTFRIKF